VNDLIEALEYYTNEDNHRQCEENGWYCRLWPIDVPYNTFLAPPSPCDRRSDEIGGPPQVLQSDQYVGDAFELAIGVDLVAVEPLQPVRSSASRLHARRHMERLSPT
jgi:hypothetical protein